MGQLATITKGPIANRMAERFGVDASEVRTILKATAFRSETPATDEQMTALMIVAEQYGLNPFTKELYAFPDKHKGIVPVVSVDGWVRIINERPELDGIEFNSSTEITTMDRAKPCPDWIECIIHRKDRTRPIVVREYLDEVYRPAAKKQGNNGSYFVDGAWQTHTKRFLRHKALIQCARVAFGFAGIYDDDEADRIFEAQVSSQPAAQADAHAAQADAHAGDVKMPQSKSAAATTEGARVGTVIEGEFSATTEDPAKPADSKPQPTAAQGGEMPLSAGMRKVLQSKLDGAGITMEQLVAGFGAVTAANINKALAWVTEQKK